MLQRSNELHENRFSLRVNLASEGGFGCEMWDRTGQAIGIGPEA